MVRKKHSQVLLNGVQILANVLITGAIPTTPGTALDVITGIIPIAPWLDEEAVKGALKLKSLDHWQYPPFGKPSWRLSRLIKENEKLMKPIPREIITKSQDETTPHLSIDQRFVVDIPTRDEYREIGDTENDVTCYTDGSKINEAVGADLTF